MTGKHRRGRRADRVWLTHPDLGPICHVCVAGLRAYVLPPGVRE